MTGAEYHTRARWDRIIQSEGSDAFTLCIEAPGGPHKLGQFVYGRLRRRYRVLPLDPGRFLVL